VEELAEAAGRLGTGDPRPLGRRYGAADLDQLADGLDNFARRLSSLLAADRELATDASHQLRTPLTALSMRLEEMIAAADDPDVVREEGSAALAQAERLADVVSQLLSPARRATTAEPTDIDEIVHQQVTEWDPAFRRARRKLVLIGVRGLQAHVTPGGLAQVLATLLDNALMHGGGTVTIQTWENARSVVIEAAPRAPGSAWPWPGPWPPPTAAASSWSSRSRPRSPCSCAAIPCAPAPSRSAAPPSGPA
jgi:signal transduction histidine kinase